MSDFFSPESKPILVEAVHRAINNGTPFDLELDLVTAKKNHRLIRIVGETLQSHGKFVKVSGTFQDLTDLRRADALLKEKTKQLEDLNRNLELRVEEEVAARTRSERILVQ